MTPQYANIAGSEGAPPGAGRPVRHARRHRLPWLRALPLLARHVTRTMPWTTLIIGCLAGTASLAVVAHFADTAHWPLGQSAVRTAFIPAIAALAFVPRTWFRPLTHATPIPAWVMPAGHLLLAAPVLAVTCWAQLRIMNHTIPLSARGNPPAIYPLIAQLTAWSLITVALATCTDRSRYADLSGIVAVPVSLAATALVWYMPVTSRYLVEPPATAHTVAIAWYAIATAALALACAAMRDHWHRYLRNVQRHPCPQRNPS
jgi:hypothetical protein